MKYNIVMCVILIIVFTGCQEKNKEMISIELDYENIKIEYEQLTRDNELLSMQIEEMSESYNEEISKLKETILLEQQKSKDIMDTNENVFSSELISKRTVKYSFNWIQIPNDTSVYQLPDTNSSIIEELNSSVVWVYDSFLDNDDNTWLLITTEAYQPMVGYVKMNNEITNIFPFSESDNKPLPKSIESINGVRLGDPLFAFDSVYTNQYAEYDSPFGIGRIYPNNYKDESNNSDCKQDYKILINTDDYYSAINSISITIEGLSLDSGIEVGHSIDKVKEVYSEYQLELYESAIVVQLSDFEYLSFLFEDETIRRITLARNLGPEV